MSGWVHVDRWVNQRKAILVIGMREQLEVCDLPGGCWAAFGERGDPESLTRHLLEVAERREWVPEGSVALAAWCDVACGAIRVLFTHPSLESVPEGQRPPEVNP